MKTMTLPIKGRDYKINFVTDKEYDRHLVGIAEPTDEGYTDDVRKVIWLKKSKMSTSLVVHELMHAIISECETVSSNLDASQTEEHCCQLTGQHFSDLNVYLFKVIDFYLRGF